MKSNYLVVGAPTSLDWNNYQTGGAYLYYYNGTNWQWCQSIYGPETIGTNFGQVVAINQSGGYTCISAPNTTVNSLPNAGAVYVYNYQEDSVKFQQKIPDPSPAANEYFGTSMAINHNATAIVVGAPAKSVGSYYQLGYVGLFTFNGSTWSQTQTSSIANPTNYLQLGELVDVDNNYAVFTLGQTNEVQFYNLASWSGLAAGAIKPGMWYLPGCCNR